MRIKEMNGSIYDSRANENLRATVAEQAATIDYLAMMADIDIPTEDKQRWEVQTMSKAQETQNVETTEQVQEKEHSPKFWDIKSYYDSGFWNNTMVKMLLRKRKLQQRNIRRLPESNTSKRRKRQVLCRSPPGIMPYDQNIDTALVGILQL